MGRCTQISRKLLYQIQKVNHLNRFFKTSFYNIYTMFLWSYVCISLALLRPTKTFHWLWTGNVYRPAHWSTRILNWKFKENFAQTWVKNKRTYHRYTPKLMRSINRDANRIMMSSSVCSACSTTYSGIIINIQRSNSRMHTQFSYIQ